MKHKTKEQMEKEREYRNEVLAFLKSEYHFTPMWVDRQTLAYRIKIGQEAICQELAEKFPGVIAIQAGHDAWHEGKKMWCVRVPFVKPNN